MDFWKVGIAQSSTYEMKMKSYMEYWEYILLHLLKPLPLQSATLLEDFWPSSNWRSNYVVASLSIIMDIVDTEALVRFPYSRLKNMKPLIAYTPFKILMWEIICLWDRTILILFLSGWEE
jgi:hypothetical protein